MLGWLFSDPLPVGRGAPAFSLQDDTGNTVSLLQHRGKENVVLVFYPADDTPGCTKQACQIRDAWADVGKHTTVVYGVNPGNAQSHAEFRKKFHLPYPLLVDEGKRVANLYNAGGLFVKRTVYLIGKDGKIRFAQRGMPSPSEVLKAAQ
jgi:peroxiredoxin Q/BCP